MTLTEPQRVFLDEVHYGVVGTLNRDGSIQQTVIWYIREGDEVRFSLGANSVKARNIRRNPTVTLTIPDGGRYLTISGTAIVEAADPELRQRLAIRYLGPERADAWLAQRTTAERASVRITIAQAYGQGING